ncbi:hypothetical protein [Undibacterium luofuense]|uniref:hypothetical protein n=1 Tax=Undibacterium luofuense TaxID=2828733 RepID=UPI0030EC0D77
MFLAACGGGGGGSADAGNSGSGSGSGTGGPVTPPVVTAQAEMLSPETGGAAYLDGQGSAARFHYLKDFAFDSKGNIFVADGSTVRKMTADGTVSLFAGQPYDYGFKDGNASDARFQKVYGIVVDSQDNVLVYDLNSVRKITPAGVVSTLAVLSASGIGSDAYIEYLDYQKPPNMVIDSKDNLYVAVSGIKKITPSGQVSDYVLPVSTIDGQAPSVYGKFLENVGSLSVDKQDNIYLNDTANRVFIRVAPDKSLKLISPTSGGTFESVAFDESGNVYVNKPYEIVRQAGNSSTSVIGTSQPGPSTDGAKAAARLQSVGKMQFNASGELWFIDANSIRKMAKDGTVTTIAGKNIYFGTSERPSTNTPSLLRVTGVVAGPGNSVYVSDGYNQAIYQLNLTDKSLKTVSDYTSWNTTPLQFPLSRPFIELQADKNGNLIFNHDRDNALYSLNAQNKFSLISKNTGKANEPEFLRDFVITPSGKMLINDNGQVIKVRNADGSFSFLAGKLYATERTDGAGLIASFTSMVDMAADSKDNLYVVEEGSTAIRKVAPDGQTSLYAGSYNKKAHLDGTLSTAAFKCPASITADNQDNLYVADPCDNAIRKISADGKVTTIDLQWTTSNGIKSRALPTPRRVFWISGKLYVFAGGDGYEAGGTLFQIPLN